MKYVSIDIETTGLNPDEHQMIEFGAIIEDTQNILPREECPTLHLYFDYPKYICTPYAAAFNADIFKTIIELKKSGNTSFLIKPELFTDQFEMFIRRHFTNDLITPAGKNFGSFDLQFLNRMPYFQYHKILHYRTLDPAMFFIDFKNNDRIPSLSECKSLANLNNIVTHRALDDAWDVITLFRTRY